MKLYVPRVAAIHDMSCFGRCSLTVIMPILSCMGIQVCPLPTAVLSTHLGGFKDVAFHDFTDSMPAFADHWRREGIQFECIYSGFLASEHQIEYVTQFIDQFTQNAPFILVDPVMGDEGRLYSVYTPKMQERMKTLVSRADVITPNYTEACFLLGKKYEEKVTNTGKMKEWLLDLTKFGPDVVVITGIPRVDNQVLNVGYQRSTGQFWEVANEYIPVKYPGTGDIFASVLAGAFLQHRALPEAMNMAADFVALGIKATFEAHTPSREGVLIECVLPWLPHA